MKAVIYLCVLGIFLYTSSATAQLFEKIKNKVEEKATQVVEEGLNGTEEGKAEDNNVHDKNKINLEETFDFKSGDSIIYASDFNYTKNGAMPLDWKTSGTGEVINVNGIGGKWLKMSERTSYKLNKNIFYPDDFTIEFDILVAADKVGDLSTLYFGFTKDNSVRRWISSDNIWAGQLMYMNDNDIRITSKSYDLYQSSTFDLEPYANLVMHVSIEVDGNRVKIYLDRTKIADTKLFQNEKAKHFYISSPLRQRHGSRVLFSNFVVKTDKT